MDIIVCNNVIKYSESNRELDEYTIYGYISTIKEDVFGMHSDEVTDKYGLLIIRIGEDEKRSLYMKQEWTILYHKVSEDDGTEKEYSICLRSDVDCEFSYEFDQLDENTTNEMGQFLDNELTDDNIIAFYDKLDLFMDRLLSIVTNIDYYSLWPKSLTKNARSD